MIYFFNVSKPPVRLPEESNADVSLRGPRDGFVEDINTNIALVRKRLKTNSLVSKPFVIGKRSQTNVQLIYMDDVQNKSMIQEVTHRLNQIDIDFIDSDSQLMELISDSKHSLFPLMEFASRPDGVAASVSRGRFAIFIDNMPSALIGPGNLGIFLHSAEDEYVPYYYASFEIFLRLTGLLVSIFLPAFFCCINRF